MERDDCSTFAIHDLAALAEGNLSPEGMERLAAHLPRCRTCMEILAALVDEQQPTHGTGNKGLAAWLAKAMVSDRRPGEVTSIEPPPAGSQSGSRRPRS